MAELRELERKISLIVPRNGSSKIFHIFYLLLLSITLITNENAQANQTNDLLKKSNSEPEKVTRYYVNSDNLVKVPTSCGKNFVNYVRQGFTKEEQPTFPGGDFQMMVFVKKNVNYPDSANLANIQGTVYIEFIVNPKGELSNFIVLKGVNKWLDMEALRVVKLLPNWLPGTVNDMPIFVKVSIPIRFRLGR